jgi:ZIP family zinc transporter
VEVLWLILAATATMFATGLGAPPVWLLGSRAEQLRPALEGVAAGVMVVASILGLLVPALDEGSPGALVAGGVLGVAFLLVAHRVLAERDVHVGVLRGAGVRRSALVFGVLLVHSLPEGLAIGAAFASDREGLDLYIVLAIALQNVPEGTATAIPMQEAGFSRTQQFWAAVATSAPQPVGAVIAYVAVDLVHEILPFSFAFAAGAMLALVAVELLPDARRVRGLAGIAAGAGVMVALSVALGV